MYPRPFLFSALLCLATAVNAAETPATEPGVAELPPPPQPAAAATEDAAGAPAASVPGGDPGVAAAPDGEEAPQPELSGEPEVTIVHREGATIEEYRVGGQLRYAKIIPSRGAPYYMFDSDGDGMLDTRWNDLDNPPINQWILKRW